MFFLMFLIAAAVVWTLGLALVRSARLYTGTYVSLSLLFVLAGLIVFTVCSWWAGIMPLKLGGDALLSYRVSFPGGYLARGALGIAVLLVGLVGVLSPALAAWITSRPPTKPRTAA